ncbi:peptidoglycan editing factor PgeF [Candidatus Peregrinibacteria bacterium]|nr:peptidoglycan editing factor PgeF [Candidatus Peregrinibacteria bacterium]
MRKIHKNNLLCYQFDIFNAYEEQLDHAVFTRQGGVSTTPYASLNVRYKIGDQNAHVLENRKRIMAAMNLKRCVSADQEHTKNVVDVNQNFLNIAFEEGEMFEEVPGVDGFVTAQKGIGLMIQVADCQNIIFYDTQKNVLGVAHAGWRGLKQNIAGEVIKMMKENYGCNQENIKVGIGPSLGPDSAEFSDPYQELGPDFDPFIDGRKVDLWRFSFWQLMHLGILEDNIEICHVDTASEEVKDEFYSYRRDNKVTGRFALVAYLK